MASSTDAASNAALTNDELSKRFYFGGLFGLPWLWIVHSLHWHGKQNDDVPPPDNDRDLEIARMEHMWVKRCQNSAIMATAAWIIWILLIQVFLTESFPSSWFVRQTDSSEATGW